MFPRQGIFCFPDFNPRSREGSDVQQSGGDFLKDNFNPRSREGSDRLAEKTR